MFFPRRGCSDLSITGTSRPNNAPNPDGCRNHAEQKLVQGAKAVAQWEILGIGASYKICQNCQSAIKRASLLIRIATFLPQPRWVTTTIPQSHQQLTPTPLAPIRYPGIMKKTDKRFLNSCPSARKSNLTQSPETAFANEGIMMKRKNGKTKLLFPQPPFNRTHTEPPTPAENPHPDSILRLIPYVCAESYAK